MKRKGFNILITFYCYHHPNMLNKIVFKTQIILILFLDCQTGFSQQLRGDEVKVSVCPLILKLTSSLHPGAQQPGRYWFTRPAGGNLVW